MFENISNACSTLLCHYRKQNKIQIYINQDVLLLMKHLQTLCSFLSVQGNFTSWRLSVLYLLPWLGNCRYGNCYLEQPGHSRVSVWDMTASFFGSQQYIHNSLPTEIKVILRSYFILKCTNLTKHIYTYISKLWVKLHHYH